METSGAPLSPSPGEGEAVDGSLAFLRGSSAGDGDAAAGQKGRVAVGVFRTADSLDSALEAFRTYPGTDVRLCLLADRSALGGGLAAGIAARNIRNLGVVLFDGDKVAERSVSPQDATTACPLVARLEDWLDARVARALRQEMATGACLLFTRVDEPEFEKFACQVLIRNSVGQVQVHDVFMHA